MATTLWPGVRLVEMLDNIVEGKRDGFDGLHGITPIHSVPFDTIYNDPYHNYFCAMGDDGFMLALHPDVKPFVQALGKPSVMKHCWFGHNSDPVVAITAATVAERYDKVALKCDETLDDNNTRWIDASGKAWNSRDDAVREIFGAGFKLIKEDEDKDCNSTRSDDLLDDKTFAAFHERLTARIEGSNVTNSWLRCGVIAYDPEAAPLLHADRSELAVRLVEQLMYETDDESSDDGLDDSSDESDEEPDDEPDDKPDDKPDEPGESERPAKRSRKA